MSSKDSHTRRAASPRRAESRPPRSAVVNAGDGDDGPEQQQQQHGPALAEYSMPSAAALAGLSRSQSRASSLRGGRSLHQMTSQVSRVDAPPLDERDSEHGEAHTSGDEAKSSEEGTDAEKGQHLSRMLS